MICLDCAHLDLKKHPKHAVLGMGQCKVQLPVVPEFVAVFEVITRPQQCDRFIAVPAGMAEARHAWWGKITKREKE